MGFLSSLRTGAATGGAAKYMAPANSNVLGVIGPTRMRYQRAITVVDSVSRTVTRLLEGQ